MTKKEIENKINILKFANNEEEVNIIKIAIESINDTKDKNELNKLLLKKMVQLAKEQKLIDELKNKIDSLNNKDNVELIKNEINKIDNNEIQMELNNYLLNKLVLLMKSEEKKDNDDKSNETLKKIEELNKKINAITNANDEIAILNLDNEIASLKNQTLIKELRNKLLAKLNNLAEIKKEEPKKEKKKSNEKINIKIVMLTGAIGLGSIIGGLTLANKPSKENITNNSNSISSSINNDESNSINNDYENGTKLFDYADSFKLDKSNPFHTQEEDCFYGKDNKEEGPFICYTSNGDEVGTCNRNYKHDDFECDIQKLIDLMNRKNIPMNEIHHISDEDRKEIQDELEVYISNNDSESAANLLERCGADPEIIFNVMEHHIIYNKNARFVDAENQEYQRGIEKWFVEHSKSDNDYYNMEAALFGAMSYYEDYLNNFKIDVTTYATVNNISEEDAEKELKKQFLVKDPNNKNSTFYSKNQVQRFEDCFYSLFCQYINEVGIDKFKEDYCYLFDSQKQLVRG